MEAEQTLQRHNTWMNASRICRAGRDSTGWLRHIVPGVVSRLEFHLGPRYPIVITLSQCACRRFPQASEYAGVASTAMKIQTHCSVRHLKTLWNGEPTEMFTSLGHCTAAIPSVANFRQRAGRACSHILPFVLPLVRRELR